jgi:hypothetical protein
LESDPHPQPSVLVVCHDRSGLQRLREWDAEGRRVVVASDDPEVQRACREGVFAATVCWLERMDSFYGATPDVLRLLDVVNGWLASLAAERRGVASYLLQWMRHVEGGYTTQRLLDAVLLIDSFLELFERYDVTRVIVCRESGCWEDEVLRAAARCRSIPVEHLTGHLPRLIVAGQRIRAAIVACGRPAYRLVRSVHFFLRHTRATRAGARSAEENAAPGGHGNTVVFQLSDCGDKHIENIAPLMHALEREGFSSVVLTCLAPDTARRARAHGLSVEELAMFVPGTAFAGALVRIAGVLCRAYRRKRRFTSDSALSYRGVALGTVVWPAIREYLSTELVKRYVTAAGLTRYFQTRRPSAMKLWGEVSLYEGHLAWKLSSRESRPLLFDYWIGIGIEWPYLPQPNPIDVFFAIGPLQADLMQRSGILSDRIAIVGSLRYGELAEFARTYSGQQSRRQIGVSRDYGLHVLWDPNLVIRGYLSPQEQLRVASTLGDVAQTSGRSCALIVKPHPSSSPGAVERWFEMTDKPVFQVPSAHLPYHAINAADVIVTKISSLGIEAMLMDRPVIAVVLDREPKWRIAFDDGAEHINSEAALTRLLVRLRDEPDFRFAWTERRLAAQRQFLSRYFAESGDPTGAAARIIAARIGARSSRDVTSPAAMAELAETASIER